MKKSPIFLSFLVVAVAGSSAWAAPYPCIAPAITFNCRSRGPNTTIAIRGSQTYSAVANSETLVDGAYRVVGTAYRFTSGGLKDRSIIQQQGNLYLVATSSEAKASELATYDAALVCNRQ